MAAWFIATAGEPACRAASGGGDLNNCRDTAGQSAGEAVLLHILDSCPVLRPVLDGAAIDGPWLSAGVIQPGIRPRYRDGVFVIGNAAGEAHPVVAEGISMAMQSAWLLAERLKAHRGEIREAGIRDQVARSYSAAWRRAFAPRIHAAAAIAHWASWPGLVQATGPLLRCVSRLITSGAWLSGKSHLVVRDDSPTRNGMVLKHEHADSRHRPGPSAAPDDAGTGGRAGPRGDLPHGAAAARADGVVSQGGRRTSGTRCCRYDIALNWLPESPGGKLDRCAQRRSARRTAERMQYFAEHAPPLAGRGGSAVMEELARRREITQLITVSCTGFEAPGIDVALMNGLESAADDAAIANRLHGLPRSDQRIAGGAGDRRARIQHARVLLCAVELCSLHYRFQWEPERLVANALFADGGGGRCCRRDAAATDDGVAAEGDRLVPDSRIRSTR